MQGRALRRRCKALLRELQIQPPLRVELLAHRLGEQWGRPIELVPESLPPGGPIGIWRRHRGVDRIYFERATSSLHQAHTILHEFGHMIAGHDPDSDGQDWSHLLNDLSPEFLSRLMTRSTGTSPPGPHGTRPQSHLDDARERDAELIATTILEWNDILGSGAPAFVSESNATEIARWDKALREQRGWQ